MGIGEFIAHFWTINDPPGLYGLGVTKVKNILPKIFYYEEILIQRKKK